MKTNTNILNLINRLAVEEAAFLRTRFLAPVAQGGFVQVRIAGAVCRVRVRPFAFTGWGVFKPVSYSMAVLDRPATLCERAAYLQLFPSARFVLTQKDGDADTWFGQPALGDDRFAFDGLVPICSVDDGELFDTVVARFDGSRFWFDGIDPTADPVTGAYLREAIVSMRDPRRIDRKGLTPEQRLAYTANHAERLRRQVADRRANGEYRLREAIAHAGAEMRAFSELKDVYRVTYTVDGRRHTSVIRKNDLTVQSAGICLSGEDRKFDLASLVGVLRAGQQQGEIFHGLQV
ncbi:MAG TPA: hypothetical protein VGN72_20240 [Tepidisphaeraceae bacterium]|jgi:hypothetical protein|nr:hypothetical protein [Tepidisphaeraceae bacterium]